MITPALITISPPRGEQWEAADGESVMAERSLVLESTQQRISPSQDTEYELEQDLTAVL